MIDSPAEQYKNGVEYQWYGDSDSEKKIVLIGGIAASTEAHGSLCRQLAKQGIGTLAINALNANVGKFPSIHDYATAVWQVVDDEMGEEEFGIGGVSWGGAVATELARDHTDQVTGVAIIGSAPMKFSDMTCRIQPMTQATALKIMGGQSFSESEEEEVRRLLAYRDGVDAKRQRLQSLAFVRASLGGSYRRNLVQYPGSMLFVYGDDDRTIRPETVKKIIAERRNAKKPTQEVVAMGGHAVTLATSKPMANRIAQYVIDPTRYPRAI